MSFRPSSTLPPIVRNADAVKYHSLGILHERGSAKRTMSRSELWHFRKCPAKWRFGKEDEASVAMKWGSLLDCIVLTPTQLEQQYAIQPKTYKTTRMVCPECGSESDAQTCRKCRVNRVEQPVELEWSGQSTHCRDWIKEQADKGRDVVSEDLISSAWTAEKRLRNHPDIQPVLESADTQVQLNVEWHDSETGLVIPFKCLLDLLPRTGSKIYDLKTTGDASFRKWQRHVFDWGYYYQAGCYVLALESITGQKHSFGHIISESDAPYECTIRDLSVEFLSLGINDFTYDMRNYCRCLKRNFFPGYDQDLVDLEPWMVMQAA